MKKQQAQQGMWLYRDICGRRVFVKEVTLADKDTEWPEFSDDEKSKWEDEHPIIDTTATTLEEIERNRNGIRKRNNSHII